MEDLKGYDIIKDGKKVKTSKEYNQLQKKIKRKRKKKKTKRKGTTFYGQKLKGDPMGGRSIFDF